VTDTLMAQQSYTLFKKCEHQAQIDQVKRQPFSVFYKKMKIKK